MVLYVVRPDDLFDVAGGVGPEPFQGDVSVAVLAAGDGRGPVGQEEELDVYEAEDRGEGRVGPRVEEEAVQDADRDGFAWLFLLLLLFLRGSERERGFYLGE